MSDEPLALDSEALALSDTEKISARHLAQVAGPISADKLIEEIHKQGADLAILECALTLPESEYRRVEDVFRRAPAPEWKHGRKTRRRR